MTKINLREFYPWYKVDTYVDVPDEVAEELQAGRRAEHAQKSKIAYHKAYYSLDCDDGIEHSVCRMEPSPEALLLQQEQTEALCQALNTLSEKQGLPGGRLYHLRHELPGRGQGRGGGQKRCPGVCAGWSKAHEKLSEKSFVIWSSIWPFFLEGYEGASLWIVTAPPAAASTPRGCHARIAVL